MADEGVIVVTAAGAGLEDASGDEASPTTGRGLAADSGNEGEHNSDAIRVARIAVCLLRLGPDVEAMFTVPAARVLSMEITSKLIHALESDTRVSEVISAPQARNLDNARTVPFFEVDPEADDPVLGVDQRLAFRLNVAIEFRVRVPRKNQPKYRSMDDVPADEYLVSWDGTVLYVQWDQNHSGASGSGGHVVLDVVEEVTKAAGYEAVVMACSRGCHHRFIHGDFVLFDANDAPDHYHLAGETPVGNGVVAPFPMSESAVDDLRRMRSHMSPMVEVFASTKSIAEGILYWGWRARTDASETLAIAYVRASKRPWFHFFGWISDSWALLGSSRRTRRLLSGQWLSLSSIDAQMDNWRQGDKRFTEQLEAPRFSELTTLFDTSADEVRALDTTTVRASLDHVAARAEGRSLRFATLIGAACALFGAIVGAAAAALLT